MPVIPAIQEAEVGTFKVSSRQTGILRVSLSAGRQNYEL
jgi:hypothetical protein